MRRAVLAFVIMTAACGGKVVFVEDDDGAQGGSSVSGPSTGGSSASSQGGTSVVTATSSTGTSMGGASPSVSCNTFECSIGQTACSCAGDCSICEDNFCSGGPVEQTCFFDAQGGQCQCFFAGELLGECFEENPDCSFDAGCCLELVKAALE